MEKHHGEGDRPQRPGGADGRGDRERQRFDPVITQQPRRADQRGFGQQHQAQEEQPLRAGGALRGLREPGAHLQRGDHALEEAAGRAVQRGPGQ